MIILCVCVGGGGCIVIQCGVWVGGVFEPLLILYVCLFVKKKKKKLILVRFYHLFFFSL